MLIRTARIVGSGDQLHDLEVRADRITAVGPSTEQTAPAQPGDEVIDLDGRWILPGLWDHHVHFEQWAIARDRLDLSSAQSAVHAAASTGAALAARDPQAEVIVGVGFRDALWPDVPTAALLDQQTGEIPAVLISADLHATWLNSAALRRFGHPDHPSGLLREGPAFDVQLAVADLAQQRRDALVVDALSAAAARGVVGIVDFEWPDVGRAWDRRFAAGMTALRVRCSVWPQSLADAVARGRRTGDELPGTFGLATMGPLKVIIDGSLNTRTAYCYDPYPGLTGPDAHGLLTVGPDELRALLESAARAGLAVAVHAIGDHANSLALDAFENTPTLARDQCSIEHAQLLREPDIERLTRLGLIASVQPAHAVDDRDVADRFWAGRTHQAFAYRSLLDAGATLALGSDAPVAPLDPWITIAAAVHRSSDDRDPWHPEQQLTIEQALVASRHSSIAAGEVADLVVVDRDPTTSSATELRTMPIAGTMRAGEWTHRQLG